jgi:hypothetical protein
LQLSGTAPMIDHAHKARKPWPLTKLLRLSSALTHR